VKARVLAFVLPAVLASCGGARPPLPLMGDVDRARAGTSQEAQLAPQAFAEADAERTRAQAAYVDGDDIAASLHAERAIAAYQRARMVARAARATADLAHAESDLAQKTDELHALETARKTAERDGEELAKRVTIERETHAPAPSGPADAQREAARLQASRALAMQARLLCGAAKLVSTSATGLDAATQQIDALDKRLEQSPKTAPIDEAAKVRTTCLSILTQARRASPATAQTAADVLLSELSAASLSPTRDERGVVVTLRDVFRGNTVAPEAQPRLEALGRVAAAHADLPIQVVVHDATPQGPSDERAKAVAASLVKGGAKADKIATVMAGTRAPVVDPNDARNRGRNARVEVVFVTGN
jgi:flagellar motor protein MotB